MIERDFCTSDDVYNEVNKIPEIGGSTEKNKPITSEFSQKFNEYLGKNPYDERASIFNRFIWGYDPFCGCTQPCFGFIGQTMSVEEVQQIVNRVNNFKVNKEV